MYASNEDEDWVYLHKTPPMNSALEGATNCVDHDSYDSSESNWTAFLSSVFSDESEQTQSDDLSFPLSSIHNSIEQEKYLSEDSIEFSQTNHQQPENDNKLLLSEQMALTSTMKMKHIALIDVNILQTDTTTDTQAVIDDNDVLNTRFQRSNTPSLTDNNDSSSITNSLRRRKNVRTQSINSHHSEINQPTPISQDINARNHCKHLQNENDLILYGICFIGLLGVVLCFLPIIIPPKQPTMNTIMNELVKTNQRLNELTNIPIANFEEKLTKQVEEKVQNIIKEQLNWHEYEKSLLISRIHGLRETLNRTQRNLTETIRQLTNENERLQEQIITLEHRLELAEEQHPNTKKTCVEGVNCTKLNVKKLFTNLFEQTASLATNTSISLSNLFEHLSASVSNIIDHHHQYVTNSKQTAKNVKKTFHHSINNLVLSFRKAKSTFATWVKSRAQARLNFNSKPFKKFSWTWIFQKDYYRERFQYQTSATKEHICDTKSSFPINKICSMKNWMVKFFR